MSVDVVTVHTIAILAATRYPTKAVMLIVVHVQIRQFEYIMEIRNYYVKS